MLSYPKSNLAYNYSVTSTVNSGVESTRIKLVSDFAISMQPLSMSDIAEVFGNATKCVLAENRSTPVRQLSEYQVTSISMRGEDVVLNNNLPISYISTKTVKLAEEDLYVEDTVLPSPVISSFPMNLNEITSMRARPAISFDEYWDD